jgi:unsaturated rhamnogalacturonyl hydrolase
MSTHLDPWQILEKVANRSLDFDFTVWQWGDAIAIDGLLEAAELLNKPEYVERVSGFYRAWCKRPLHWPDHLCPGLGLLKLYTITGEQVFLDSALRLSEFLLMAPRARASGAPLYRPDLGPVRACVWVDTLYHEPPFFCELARITGEASFFDHALQIWFSHFAVLKTDRGPFLHHAVDTGLHAFKGYGWGRGQGWALYGMVDTLERLPPAHPGYAEALACATQLASALLQYQDASGFWRTLIHDREAYLETSTAGFIGGAFFRGTRLGILPEAYRHAADRAWNAFQSSVDMETGDVFGVSTWTHAGVTLDDSVSMYKSLPTETNWWGQGCGMRIAAEVIRNNRTGVPDENS